MPKQDATHLFERPFRRPRSEHFWTGLVATFFLHHAQDPSPRQIQTWRLNGQSWEYERYGWLNVDGLTWGDIFVETNLAPFVKSELKKELPKEAGFEPDIIICQKREPVAVTLIEVKTAGKGFSSNDVRKYSTMRSSLKELGISSRCLLLCSIGHGKEYRISPERIVEAQDCPSISLELLLWEDLLLRMGNDRAFRHLLPSDVLNFTQMGLKG